MASEQYKDQKRPLEYSKKQIDKAARSIRHSVIGEERKSAITKIQSYREFHLYPLMLMKNHLARTARAVSPNAIVARRLKRLPTIINKLERPTLDGNSENAIKLTRMQDIAGCRAIVKNKKELYQLKDKLEHSKSVHKIVRTQDYLTKPKDSGYGGLHLIYSCYEGLENTHPWKKASVEIQLRTKLQHAWATSLEIIDTLESINLKTSITGHSDWRRFFSLAGKLIAHDEGLCIIDDEFDRLQLFKDLFVLEQNLEVISKLRKYNLAISLSDASDIPKSKRSGKGLFLILMEKANSSADGYSVSVEFFDRSKAEKALKRLNESELDDTYILSVLVSAEGVRSLRQAYPNYFGSSQDFIKFLNVHDKIYTNIMEKRAKEALKTLEEMKQNSKRMTEDEENMKRDLLAFLESLENIRKETKND